MPRLLVALLFLVGVQCECPAGFSAWTNGQCYMVASQSEMVFYSALQLCEKAGAELPSVHSEHESLNLYAAANLKGIKKYWLGLECDKKTGYHEQWTDGTAIDYYPQQLLDCTWSGDLFYYQSGNSNWQYTSEYGKAPVICQAKNLNHTAPTCEDYSSYDYVTCISVVQSPLSWAEAEAECRNQGANLASIHSRQMNDYLRRSAIGAGITWLNVGMRMMFGQYNYSWVDDSPLDFLNFAPGFPNGAFGDCFFMQSDTTAGQWMNDDCSKQASFVCARPIYDPSVTVISSCPSTFSYTDGDNVFSPSYPAAVANNLDCNYVFTVNSGKVEIEIVNFETNYCCSSVEIFEGYFGGDQLITSLSGSVASGTRIQTTAASAMRLRYRSSDGSGARGWHLKIRAV